jgi:UDP-N-acetylglucosamine 3-dehydrogenase
VVARELTLENFQETVMDRLRIGVIGLGWFGEIHCDAIKGVPNLELAGLCTRTPARLEEMASKFGVGKATRDYRELLADPRIDAVSIVTMWDQHTEPAIAALEVGKHVFLEKPIASTVKDGRKIIAAAARSKGILQIGHICRFNPRYRMAKKAIAEGRIGKIVAMSSRRNIPAAWTPQILNKIGPIVGDAIHDTDLLLWFTGDRIVSAYAQTVDVRGLKYPDIGQTMYRFAAGATATLETVWCMPEKTPFDIDERMSIIGDAGIIPARPKNGLPASNGAICLGLSHDKAPPSRRPPWRSAVGVKVSSPARAETPPPDPWPFLSLYGLGNTNENFLPPPP